MSVPSAGPSRKAVRWIPAVAVPIAIAVGVVVVPMQANAAVDLPDLTPKQLLEFAAASDVTTLSGTIEQTSELGLPDLSALKGDLAAPSTGGAGSAGAGLDDLLSLITTDHTAKVYVDGSNARLQVLDRLAERDVYASASGAWIYDSSAQAATHVVLPPDADLDALATAMQGEADAAKARLEAELGAALPTPEAMLDQALARLGDSTDVSVGTDSRVAGRDAYELVLEPGDPDTLVGEVSIAIDGENGVPLAASVTARGASEPAFSVAFTDIGYTAPDASVFAFTPPEGTDVTEQVIPVPTVAELEQWQAEGATGAATDHPAPPVTVHGEGWSAVVELEPAAAQGAPTGGAGAEASAMLDAITQPVAGGRLLSTSLVNVLFTDDGRVFAGAVSADRLAAAASER
ncbi:LolA family protein [Agromyces cerinus]|uniref:Outer membrane lipoprotein-sorting protein n=1 Tax=Agromyces cerinus subsp. cerinus TaxID=232089 RepID=A0A1N6EP42_9MICO|nr:hypothetical protein [Agromyces cerinus]SIN84750.1 hypothetical protein SAMN05443544_1330 [Agromyces cerinus subsp. cerinus]